MLLKVKSRSIARASKQEAKVVQVLLVCGGAVSGALSYSVALVRPRLWVAHQRGARTAHTVRAALLPLYCYHCTAYFGMKVKDDAT